MSKARSPCAAVTRNGRETEGQEKGREHLGLQTLVTQLRSWSGSPSKGQPAYAVLVIVPGLTAPRLDFSPYRDSFDVDTVLNPQLGSVTPSQIKRSNSQTLLGPLQEGLISRGLLSVNWRLVWPRSQAGRRGKLLKAVGALHAG